MSDWPGKDICEYCNEGDITLFAFGADIWCGECLLELNKVTLNELAGAAHGRPINARYDVPFVYQTPDGRIQKGKVYESQASSTD